MFKTPYSRYMYTVEKFSFSLPGKHGHSSDYLNMFGNK